MIHQINKDLFCQSILVPLIMDHHIIAQVSGHGRDIIKLIPPLVFDQNDADRFIEAFDQVLTAAHRFPGPIWEVGSRIAKGCFCDRTAKRENQHVKKNLDSEQKLSGGHAEGVNLGTIFRSPAAYVGLGVGVAIFACVIAWQGIDDVAEALRRAGWGLILITLLHLPPLWADAIGWRTLIPRGQQPPRRTMNQGSLDRRIH